MYTLEDVKHKLQLEQSDDFKKMYERHKLINGVDCTYDEFINEYAEIILEKYQHEKRKLNNK